MIMQKIFYTAGNACHNFQIAKDAEAVQSSEKDDALIKLLQMWLRQYSANQAWRLEVTGTVIFGYNRSRYEVHNTKLNIFPDGYVDDNDYGLGENLNAKDGTINFLSVACEMASR